VHCSISWDISFKRADTNNISVIDLPFLVKILFSSNNQLVTKNGYNDSHLVGTSETIRASTCTIIAPLLEGQFSNIGLLLFKTQLECNKNENLFNE
jgi:hypothetical protein